MAKNLFKMLVDAISDRTLFSTKEVLTSREVARYMGISLSTLYKLTMDRKIPHAKPTGKLIYFNRKEVEAWLQRNHVGTDTESQVEPQNSATL